MCPVAQPKKNKEPILREINIDSALTMLLHRVALSEGSTFASVVSFPLTELLTPLHKQLRLHFSLPGL